jgi:hypothetical protein
MQHNQLNLLHYANTTLGPSPPNDTTAIVDTGAIGNYLKPKAPVYIQKEGITLLTGSRDPINGLWRIPLETPTSPPAVTKNQCHDACQTTSTAEIMQYLHTATFSPVTSTWLKAIERGFFHSWPGLTTKTNFITSMSIAVFT